jgi:hypothetical protein
MCSAAGALAEAGKRGWNVSMKDDCGSVFPA